MQAVKARSQTSLHSCPVIPEPLFPCKVRTQINVQSKIMLIFPLASCVYNTLSTECRQLITIANSLDPDQARQNVGPDLGPNCWTLWWYSWNNFSKKLILYFFGLHLLCKRPEAFMIPWTFQKLNSFLKYLLYWLIYLCNIHLQYFRYELSAAVLCECCECCSQPLHIVWYSCRRCPDHG